ncbi:hypothetical protein PLICRDRAFT_546836 [Plicaturopsis crispa FD-325 SS-3]|nr:hypothetical protein PLICRDRAFT_546836 [Plicaturopsis crispa FD-325 SS-3]
MYPVAWWLPIPSSLAPQGEGSYGIGFFLNTYLDRNDRTSIETFQAFKPCSDGRRQGSGFESLATKCDAPGRAYPSARYSRHRSLLYRWICMVALLVTTVTFCQMKYETSRQVHETTD